MEGALEKNSEVPRAHYYLGTVDLFAHGLHLLDEAFAHFEAEERVSPGDPMTNLYLGTALVEKRQFRDALVRLQMASRQLPERADTWQYLGRAHLELEDYEAAISDLRRALELAGQELPPGEEGNEDRRQRRLSSVSYQLGRALRGVGREEEAEVHFTAAKESSAESAEGTRQLLDVYLNDEDGSEPLAASTWPLELTPLSGVSAEQRGAVEATVDRALVQAYFNLGLLQTKAGSFLRAATLYSLAAEIEPGFPRLQLALGTAVFSSGQYQRATGPLLLARKEAPEDLNLRRMLALAWFNAGRHGEAVGLLATDPGLRDNPTLEYTYAAALVRSGRGDEAEPIYARLIESNADWPELNVLLGQVHAQQDDFEGAIAYLQRAIELDPRVAEARSTLGDIFLRQGKLEEAEQSLRAEVALHPDDVRAEYTLAVVLDLHRKPMEALGVLRPLLEREPDFADGKYLLGKVLLAQGAADEARGQLEAAVALAPGDPNIRYQLGQAYQRLGFGELAAREFEVFRQLKKDPEG